MRLDACRKSLIKEARGEREACWADIRRASRAPKGHWAILLRLFQREGLPVRARRPREKPGRTSKQALQREAFCKHWSNKPDTFWTPWA